MTVEPPVLVLMTRLTPLTEGLRARPDAVAPGIDLHWVPYQEEYGLRRARAAGRVSDTDRATAPRLTDEDWAPLERATAVVLLDMPDALLERTPRLRWVQSMAAGTEHLDARAMAARGITLTSGAGIAAVPIAEFVLGRLLQVWKGFRTIDANQARSRWKLVMGRRLSGLTLGIVGLGAIGRATARRARAFEMHVIANRRSAQPGDSDPDVDELFTAEALDDMLPRCDAVVIAAAATPETVGLFDRGRIARMKPDAVLCNVARGSIVDENALEEALRSGRLAAAVLDTTADEPTHPEHPLWTAPNCYLSPHTAAAADGFAEALMDLVVRNLDRFVRNEALENVVVPISSGAP